MIQGMPKLRVYTGCKVWVLDTKAWLVATRNSNNRYSKSILHADLTHSWNDGDSGYSVKLMPLSNLHKWFWINVNGQSVRVHDSEVVRI